MSKLTFDQLKEQVKLRLLETGSAEQKRRASADEVALEILAAFHTIPDAERRVDADLLKKDVFYAIPDDALELLPSIAKTVFSALTDGPVHALGELVGILYRYRTLRVTLDVDEAAVIRALRTAKRSGEGPLAPADIQVRLKGDGIRLQRPLAAILTGLEAKNTDKTMLVKQSNERWVVGNV